MGTMGTSVNNKGRLRRLFAWGITLALCLGFASPILGQTYLVHRYSEEQGLPSSNVSGLSQDSWGRMWFATRVGVSCYDGVNFENYTTAHGLSATSYNKMAVDRQGAIWALGNRIDTGFNISIFRDNRWISMVSPRNLVRFSEISGFQVIDIEMPPQVVATTPDSRLICFQDGQWRHLSSTAAPRSNWQSRAVIGMSGDGLIYWQEDKWTRVSTADGLLSDTVNDVASWQQKCLIATGEGLSILNADGTIDNSLDEKLHLPAGGIKSMVIEHAGLYPSSPIDKPRIWLYGEGWLGHFSMDNPKMEYVPVHPRFTRRGITPVKMMPDYRRGLYIGNRYEIFYFDFPTQTLSPLGIRNGLIGEGCHALYIDFEKNIWIAGERGVSKIASRRFETYQLGQGLSEDEVTAVAEYEPGKYILGHNQGLTFWEDGHFTPFPFGILPGRVSSLYRSLEIIQDPQQRIWIAASNAGLAEIDRNKNIRWHCEELISQGNQIVCLHIDWRGNFWVGSNLGLFLKKGDRFIPVLTQTGIRKIYARKDDTLVIGTMGRGILLSRGKSWQEINYPGGGMANSVYALKEDRKGRLWVGTGGGLFTLDRDKLAKFVEKGFSIDRPVYFIQEDNHGRLWFGTDNGVVRWDGKKPIHYSTIDGLAGQETNRGTGIIDSRGRLLIGTNRGLSIYEEGFDNADESIPPPRLNLLHIEVNDREVPLTENMVFGHDTHSLVFHFRGISFLDEKAIRFQYKLEGFDKGWIGENYPYNQMVRYSNLPGGHYHFHLKAKNALGVWSDTITTANFSIRGPFYRQWWFLLIAFLLTGLISFALFRFFNQQRYAILLEKQVAERTDQLREVESQYRNLFEESMDVIYISTPEGLFLEINPAGIELFGFQSREEALDTYVIWNYYYPEDRANLTQALDRQGYIKNYEVALRKKQGDKIVVQITATVVRDKQGKITAYRGIIRDITEKKRLEQQLLQSQKMEAIGTLAGGIAHDFNNILGVILGYTELLLDDLPKQGAIRRNVEHIEVAAQRAAGLVKQILTFSRRGDQQRKPLRLSLTIEEALKLLRSSLPSTIDIRQNLRATADIIQADITQINQVIMNLGANAAFAMKGKTGILEISLDEVYLDAEAIKSYTELKPGPYLRLSVHDTGRGIPREVLKHIFEPYFTTKKIGEGTGMGLAVIHGIVKGHRGDITVYSEPEKGTTFNIFFPQLQLDGDFEETSHQVEDLPGGTERILLVDDEKELTQVGSQMLERLGYAVYATTSPREALKLFKQDAASFRLIITDLTMPQMTGIQLARQVKRIDPGIPIILCSGYGDPLARERSKALGINDFIIKPIVKSELSKVVRRVLDNPLPAPTAN